MDDLTIFTFEKQLIELINKTPLPNRAKWYVVKDVADKLLKASENDIQKQINSVPKQEGEKANE